MKDDKLVEGTTNQQPQRSSEKSEREWRRRESTNGIRYADLFGGVGGFRLGIERASNSPRRTSKECSNNDKSIPSTNEGNGRGGRTCSNNLQTKCVFYSDIDKYSVQTYNKNFKENHEPTDITKISTDDIPEIDMVCGGFPCQAFSIAGKRRGFEDTRGTLFFEVARIIKAKRPKIVFLENVKGLLNHNKGETFRTIIQTISELGYDVQWMVLNSKFFGVPQNRERVFIIGSLRGERRPEILPFKESNSTTDKELEKKPMIIGTTKSNTAQGTNSRSWVHDVNGIIGAVNSTEYKQPKQIFLKTNTKLGYDIAKENEDGIRLQFENSRTARGRVIKGASQTLQASVPGVFDGKIRRLTPTECERLQGFPDGWTEGVSDTQRYKQMGNAVTVNVIEAIARKLLTTQNTQEMNSK